MLKSLPIKLNSFSTMKIFNQLQKSFRKSNILSELLSFSIIFGYRINLKV